MMPRTNKDLSFIISILHQRLLDNGPADEVLLNLLDSLLAEMHDQKLKRRLKEKPTSEKTVKRFSNWTNERYANPIFLQIWD